MSHRQVVSPNGQRLRGHRVLVAVQLRARINYRFHPVREGKLGESPGPSGGTENIPPGRQRAAEREKFSAPPPTGGTGYERRAPEHRPPPTGLNQPGNPPPAGAPPKGGLPGETRDARGTGQGAYAQPGGPPPRGGGQPPAGEGGQKGPQHGQKKPEKGTPPPGPQ